MRIQETNEILNEARSLRRAHQQHDQSVGGWAGVRRSLMKVEELLTHSRGLQVGLATVGVAAMTGALGALLYQRRNNLGFSWK